MSYRSLPELTSRTSRHEPRSPTVRRQQLALCACLRVARVTTKDISDLPTRQVQDNSAQMSGTHLKRLPQDSVIFSFSEFLSHFHAKAVLTFYFPHLYLMFKLVPAMLALGGILSNARCFNRSASRSRGLSPSLAPIE